MEGTGDGFQFKGPYAVKLKGKTGGSASGCLRACCRGGHHDHAPCPLGGLFPLSTLTFLAACTPQRTIIYATPDYHSWKKTTTVVLDYPIFPGHQNRFRVPRMNEIGFTAKPTIENGKNRWAFPEGTVIVKEVYATPKPAAGEQPIQLTPSW